MKAFSLLLIIHSLHGLYGSVRRFIPSISSTPNLAPHPEPQGGSSEECPSLLTGTATPDGNDDQQILSGLNLECTQTILMMHRILERGSKITDRGTANLFHRLTASKCDPSMQIALKFYSDAKSKHFVPGPSTMTALMKSLRYSNLIHSKIDEYFSLFLKEISDFNIRNFNHYFVCELLIVCNDRWIDQPHYEQTADRWYSFYRGTMAPNEITERLYSKLKQAVRTQAARKPPHFQAPHFQPPHFQPQPQHEQQVVSADSFNFEQFMLNIYSQNEEQIKLEGDKLCRLVQTSEPQTTYRMLEAYRKLKAEGFQPTTPFITMLIKALRFSPAERSFIDKAFESLRQAILRPSIHPDAEMVLEILLICKRLRLRRMADDWYSYYKRLQVYNHDVEKVYGTKK